MLQAFGRPSGKIMPRGCSVATNLLQKDKQTCNLRKKKHRYPHSRRTRPASVKTLVKSFPDMLCWDNIRVPKLHRLQRRELKAST